VLEHTVQSRKIPLGMFSKPLFFRLLQRIISFFVFIEVEPMERFVDIVCDIVPVAELVFGFESALRMKFEVVGVH
jgi:hypothetical protein